MDAAGGMCERHRRTSTLRAFERAVRGHFCEFLEGAAPLDAAIALDPKDAAAHDFRGQAPRDLGRLDEARIAFERSAAASPMSSDALVLLAQLDSEDGKCLDFEQHTKLAAERSLSPSGSLVAAYVANGRSEESSKRILDQILVKVVLPPLRRQRELEVDTILALVAGDFTSARRLDDEEAALVATSPDLAQSRKRRWYPAQRRVWIAQELGEDAEVIRVAREFSNGAQEWSGAMDEERDEAIAALAALPRFGGLAALEPPTSLPSYGLVCGDLFHRVGRLEEAIPFLRRGLASCERYFNPTYFPGASGFSVGLDWPG